MSGDTSTPPCLVGRFSDGRKVHFLPLSDTEIERTSWFYRRILTTYTLPYRSVVLVISKFEDAALVIPLERALVTDGFIPCNAEATGFDAARTESFLRRLNPPLVFGLNMAVVAGLEALGHSPEQLLAGRIVWVRDEDAYRRLAGCPGITLRRWQEVGPAPGIECMGGEGLHLHDLEWLVTEDDGWISVTSKLNRALTFERQATGVRGRVVNTVCRCGVHGPRVIWD